LEVNVTIKVREADVDLAEAILPNVIADYTEITGKPCHVLIENDFLSPKR
jgi:hypothetical protein